MVNRLSGLLSKSRKPLIVNGKVLMYKGNLVAVRRENYRVIMSYLQKGGQEVVIDESDKLLNEEADSFNKEFAFPFPGVDNNLNEFVASIDSFTGAIVVKNKLYDILLDKNNNMNFHDDKYQFKQDVKDLIEKFNTYYIVNYFGIYLYLLNRRLTGSYMPMKIKGHLTNGLFQPLVVRTKSIDCPLELPEFHWFHDMLDNPESCEKRLEGVMETTRGLELTVIAMSDFYKKFGGGLLRDFNKIYFVYIIYCNLLHYLYGDKWMVMTEEYNKLYSTMQSGLDINPVPIFLPKRN